MLKSKRLFIVSNESKKYRKHTIGVFKSVKKAEKFMEHFPNSSLDSAYYKGGK